MVRRPSRTLIGLGAVALGATLALSACGQQSGLDLARQACVHVNESLHDFSLAERPGTSASVASPLRTQADRELRMALPLAADANSADGTWNSLMTTISEISTVDESHLAPALKAQCALANTNINVNPEFPTGNQNPSGG
jgi:hypothetical protein